MSRASAMYSIVPVRFTRRRFSSSRAVSDSRPSRRVSDTARRIAKAASSRVSPCSARVIRSSVVSRVSTHPPAAVMAAACCVTKALISMKSGTLSSMYRILPVNSSGMSRTGEVMTTNWPRPGHSSKRSRMRRRTSGAARNGSWKSFNWNMAGSVRPAMKSSAARGAVVSATGGVPSSAFMPSVRLHVHNGRGFCSACCAACRNSCEARCSSPDMM